MQTESSLESTIPLRSNFEKLPIFPIKNHCFLEHYPPLLLIFDIYYISNHWRHLESNLVGPQWFRVAPKDIPTSCFKDGFVVYMKW